MNNIRNIEISDTEAVLKIYEYYVLNTAITFEYDTPSIEEFKERIINIKNKYPYLVILNDDKIVGYAYANDFKDRRAYDWSVEISIYIDANYLKKGFGGLLYRRLEKELIDMGITNAYACIGYPNIEDEYLNYNSFNFHKHMGFNQCGFFKSCGYKFNNWYNMVWMEKIIGEHYKNQNNVKFKEAFK